MLMRIMAVWALVAWLTPLCLADTVVLKDGTKKEVQIYKLTKDYVSYIHKGHMDVVRRDELKAGREGIEISGDLPTDEELAEAIKRARCELKKKVRKEERETGIRPAKKRLLRFVTAPKKRAKGVEVIKKEESKTAATELKIDPFPDYPVKKNNAAEKQSKRVSKK